PTSTVPVEPLGFHGTFTDPADSYTSTLTWQIHDASGAVVAAGKGADFNFVATQTGTYEVALTVDDGDGGVSMTSQTLTVSAAMLQAAPGDSGQTALFVGGTTASDVIQI